MGKVDRGAKVSCCIAWLEMLCYKAFPLLGLLHRAASWIRPSSTHLSLANFQPPCTKRLTGPRSLNMGAPLYHEIRVVFSRPRDGRG